ncbi:DUF2242 domain-containing protein [Noviherbaspirillum saxi]|uniref:DUF2242 domain-containing protein n=1 Tax=Noviherbaspirillum saxi TaxID=2320863 RepID=A0A3A3G7L3_9BURK|nr:DUF2242 domain-containing protein [Noviherbaspirillum saxi]RJF96170.1 DUF2242 domain-containing protein [Noviherbaspirillum saxi]
MPIDFWRQRKYDGACQGQYSSLVDFLISKMLRSSSLIAPVMLMTALCGCANMKPAALQSEQFLSSGSHVQSFPGTPERTCEAARRALLSQGYVIGDSTESLVKGRKYFQPETDTHTQIEFHVVCAPNSEGSNSTTVFANAVRDRYSLRKSSNSASLGVGAIGSISLPFGSSDDALVKVGTETIPSKQFYSQFFELVERYLDPVTSIPAQS